MQVQDSYAQAVEQGASAEDLEQWEMAPSDALTTLRRAASQRLAAQHGTQHGTREAALSRRAMELARELQVCALCCAVLCVLVCVQRSLSCGYKN